MTKTDKKTQGKKTVTKKPVAKKTTKKPAVKKKTKLAINAKKSTTKKPAQKVSAKPAKKFIVSHEQHFHMVSEAAYFRSLSFQTDSPVENWFEAEKSIALICEIH